MNCDNLEGAIVAIVFTAVILLVISSFAWYCHGISDGKLELLAEQKKEAQESAAPEKK